MKIKLHWDRKKNDQLKVQRGIGFEAVAQAVKKNKILADDLNTNQKRYPGQRTMIVDINSYAYVVPYVPRSDDSLFLKTIYPSRKHTKKYLNSRNDN